MKLAKKDSGTIGCWNTCVNVNELLMSMISAIGSQIKQVCVCEYAEREEEETKK